MTVTERLFTCEMRVLKSMRARMLAVWANAMSRFAYKLNRVSPSKMIKNSIRPISQKKMHTTVMRWSNS